MKFKGILLIIVSTLLFTPSINAGSLIQISALNQEFSGLPGDMIVIPFEITNFGNESVSNITVYLTGPSEGFLYQTKAIKDILNPGETLEDRLILKILNIEPGSYEIKIIARVGKIYSEDDIIVRVRTLVDFELRIKNKDQYIYGKHENILLEVHSNSNGILTGKIGYILSKDSKVISSITTVTYIPPQKSWKTKVPLKELPPGRYSLLLWANFSGVYKELYREFEIYQRNLTYITYYKNGAIHVQVFEKGRGVNNIDVYINGIHFTTNEYGLVEYPITQAGSYQIRVNLDGRIEETTLEVKKLNVEVGQIRNNLWVRIKENNIPLSNITVIVFGPLGKAYDTTNESGITIIPLDKVGYGTLLVKAESEKYLPGEAIIKVIPPELPTITPTPSTTTSSPTTTTTTTTTPAPPKNYGPLAAILLIAGLILAGTSYTAFFMPVIQEETLDRYYFVKVKAPKLRGIENFRFERPVNAAEVKATKGSVKVEDNTVVWEIEHLEPEEEAYLQVILG